MPNFIKTRCIIFALNSNKHTNFHSFIILKEHRDYKRGFVIGSAFSAMVQCILALYVNEEKSFKGFILVFIQLTICRRIVTVSSFQVYQKLPSHLYSFVFSATPYLHSIELVVLYDVGFFIHTNLRQR